MATARSLFMGAYPLKVDAKGRIAMPADFRREIERDAENDGFVGFMATPSLTGDELECAGLGLAHRVRQMIDERFDPYSEEAAALTEALIGLSRKIPFDGDGRFILPPPLRAHAGIEDRVVLIGLGSTFRIRKGEGDVALPERTLALARTALSQLKRPTREGA